MCLGANYDQGVIPAEAEVVERKEGGGGAQVGEGAQAARTLPDPRIGPPIPTWCVTVLCSFLGLHNIPQRDSTTIYPFYC